MGSVAGVGPPSPARSARSVSASAFSSSASSGTEERVSVMHPPPTGRPGVGGGRSKGDRSTSGRDRGNSGSAVEPTLAVEGSSIPRPTSSLLDLSLSGSVAVGSLLMAAGVTGAGVLPGPAAPVTSAAPVACSSASVVAPAGAGYATALPGRCERTRESSRPAVTARR